jgi:chromate transport protein ChrA
MAEAVSARASEDEPAGPAHPTFAQASRTWARIALLSFGGPAGQIAVMHRILVEEKRWLGERRFLHALNFCMLLPGPEAQQLAIHIGWLLHRTPGGIVAGVLFVLPGLLAIMSLSWVYAIYGNVGVVDALFFGLKVAVLAIVLQAVVRNRQSRARESGHDRSGGRIFCRHLRVRSAISADRRHGGPSRFLRPPHGDRGFRCRQPPRRARQEARGRCRHRARGGRAGSRAAEHGVVPQGERRAARPVAGAGPSAACAGGQGERVHRHRHLLFQDGCSHLRRRLCRPCLRRAGGGRHLRLAGAGRDAGWPRHGGDDAWPAHHGHAVRRLYGRPCAIPEACRRFWRGH